MSWPFGRRSAKKEREPPPREKDIPSDEERGGPAPPPPPTTHAPGVSVYRFDAIPSPNLLRRDEGYGGFFLEGEEGRNRSSALLVLWAKSAEMNSAAAGAAAAHGGGGAPAPPPPALGDVLIWTTAALAAPPPPGASSLSPLEEISRTSHPPRHHIRRDDLGGKAVPGITGLRTLARLPEERLAVLRLGPPPTARWAFRGVRAMAVFSGKFTLVDGEEAKLVHSGSLAFVADPSATLYLEAGNDAALAVALAAPGFVAALS
jgi:hypothetical protein